MAIELPLDVDDSETIIRVIFKAHERDGGSRLHRNAFDDGWKRRGISVIRVDYTGADFCKRHALTLERRPDDKARSYRGLAAVRVRPVRAMGSIVVDSRAEFLGHADIHHPSVARVGDDPPPAHALEKLNKNLDDLCCTWVKYYVDPSPETEGWKGPSLEAP